MKTAKKFLALILAVVLALCVVPAYAVAAANVVTGDSSETAVVLYTNDVHCAIDNYSKLAGYRSLLIEEGFDVVTVDAGDHIQGEVIGSLTYGSAIVDIMNSVGYDFAVAGNHEFDYGMDTFLDIAMGQAEYEYLGCNFIDLADGKPVLKPYEIVEMCGVSVAFIGISTPETYTKSTPAYFQDENGDFIYSFCENTLESFYNTIQDNIDAAVNEGAECVVAIGHLGVDGVTEGWRSTDVIANTVGIDAFIDAHSHETANRDALNKDGNAVLLTSTGTKLEKFGALYINTDGTLEAELIDFSTLEVEPDEVVKNKVDGYNSDMEYLFEELGTSEVELTLYDPETGDFIVRKAETNMGNFVADAYKAASGAEIAFVNAGGIRTTVDMGVVTRKELMDVNPWNNQMCVVELTGEQILDALEFSVRLYPETCGGFLQTAGLTYELHTYVESPALVDGMGMFTGFTEGAERRVRNVKVNGEDLVPDKLYTVVGSVYMLCQNGDGYTMFKDAEIIEKDGLPVDSEMLIMYLTETLSGVITEEMYGNAFGDGRITVQNEPAETPTPAPTEIPEREPNVETSDSEVTAVTFVAVLALGVVLLKARSKKELGA